MIKQLLKVLLLNFCLQLLAVNSLSAQTGTWHALTNLPPNSNMGVCLLMTDGTVICKSSAGGGEGTSWDKLTPDATGSYINGTWTSISNMNNNRLFFSSQVLPSGQVYVAGGEYGPGGTNGEVYDPVANTWTMCGPIPGGWDIYDGNSEILYDGTVLEGPQIGPNISYNILIWSPVTNQYTIEPNSIYDHDEAEWVKLRDSSVLFVGIASQNANRYIPQTGTWVNDANTPGQLYDQYGEEAGCGFMLPNGKAIFFGATPYNCIYTPSGNASPGTWASADSFPKINGGYVGQPDAAGAMMVNGHILLAVSPIGDNLNEFKSPAYFVEYDYTTNKFTQVKSTIPGMGGDSIPYIACFQTQMLDLPDGNVLLSISQTGGVNNQYFIYTPGSSAIAAGKPTINNIIPQSCTYYKITGKLFNGISEGAAYGDDWQMSTNYPLVRLTNGPDIYYAKTTNWNRIGAVQTDSLEDTAYFTIPAIPVGTYSLSVVVNGFASNPVLFSTVLGSSVASQTNVSCHGGSNGTATVTTTNGFGPYTYLWSPSAQTNVTATGLSAGIYTVVVHSGCGTSASATVTITQPNILTGANAVVITNEVCSGNNVGSASVSTIGGGSPFTYLWTPSGQTNANATGLTAGTYTVKVNDACGKSATATVTITQPNNLTVSTFATENISCNGDKNGAASANVSNGTSPYTYAWSPLGETTATIAGLSAGVYTLNVTDNHGCTGSASINITQPNMLSTSLAVTSNVFCNGGNDGSISSSTTGGTSPYIYAWTGGGGSNATAAGLSMGTYTLNITDKNGCTCSAATTITQPTPIVVIRDSTPDDGGCTGTAWVIVNGGVLPYTYLWSNGNTTYYNKYVCGANTYCCTITDANQCKEDVCIYVNSDAGINNLTSSNSGGITVYPNPSGGQFTFSFTYPSAIAGAQFTIEVYNVLGEKVYSNYQIAQSSNCQINLSTQPNGIYLYRVIAENGNLMGEGKLVITK